MLYGLAKPENLRLLAQIQKPPTDRFPNKPQTRRNYHLDEGDWWSSPIIHQRVVF
jgi:hypothetical protein